MPVTHTPVGVVLLLARARQLGESGEGRRIRTERRLSLSDIATAIGTSSTTVLRWERGEVRPTGAAGVAYAELLAELEEQP